MRIARTAAGWLGCTGALLLAGCQVTLPRAADAPPIPRESNAELVLFISNEAFVTAEPAYRAVHVLATGESFAGEYTELAEKLRSERLIGGSWNHPPDQVLTRAEAGYMVARAAKVRTGVNWNLTGLGRYAWRELIFHGIAAGGSELAYLSGGEFVGILARADEYMHRRGRHEQAPAELTKPG